MTVLGVQVFRVPLALLFAVALLFSASQCVASCAALDCKSPVPPCHQQHDRGTLKACPQELTFDVVHRVPVAPEAVNASPPDVAVAPFFVGAERPVLPALPPDLAASSSRILRI